MFSIIVPSYLSPYTGSASNQEEKFIRAIDSVMNQTFKDFELIVVSDGCDKTIELCKGYDLTLLSVKKHPIFSGFPRNAGIDKATQEFICYLDTDDIWGDRHLSIMVDGICDKYKWFFFNDWIWKNGDWIERKCQPMVKGQNGTSNICHRRDAGIQWGDGYLHDWEFIRKFHRFPYKRIPTCQYRVAHIPGRYEV